MKIMWKRLSHTRNISEVLFGKDGVDLTLSEAIKKFRSDIMSNYSGPAKWKMGGKINMLEKSFPSDKKLNSFFVKDFDYSAFKKNGWTPNVIDLIRGSFTSIILHANDKTNPKFLAKEDHVVPATNGDQVIKFRVQLLEPDDIAAFVPVKTQGKFPEFVAEVLDMITKIPPDKPGFATGILKNQTMEKKEIKGRTYTLQKLFRKRNMPWSAYFNNQRQCFVVIRRELDPNVKKIEKVKGAK